MPTIIFVHGTGVRKKEYAESLGAIRNELAGLKGWKVHPCLWGEEHGAKLGERVFSIPDFDETRKKEEALSAEDRKIALWAALYEDPLYELRLLELKPRSPGHSVFNQPNVFLDFDPLVRGLVQAESLAAPLAACQLDRNWEDAIGELRGSDEYRRALSQAERPDTDLREAIARALAVLALRRRGPKLIFEPMSGAARDGLVDSVVEALGGRDQSAFRWLCKQALAKPFTSYVQRNRGQVSADGFAIAGDILLYQARGQAILDFIQRAILEAEPPVVLLAHSLGGIACVDLLNEQNLSDRVPLLITAGSQAPFLYEINALVSLPFGEPLKNWSSRRWLNIYDPRDFLSYQARDIFHGPDIEDLRVDNQEPFPQSHGAYWSNAQVWKAIRKELQKLTQ